MRKVFETGIGHIYEGKSMKILLGEKLCCIRLVQLKDVHATFFIDASARVRSIFRAPMTASMVKYGVESDSAKDLADS